VVEIIYPAKLRRGGEIRVIAPSISRGMVTEYDHTAIIDRRFAELGLAISYGAHVDERDPFDSSAVVSRVADLHAAFADPAIAAVMTVIGGYNSNELLPSLDWELIRANPNLVSGDHRNTRPDSVGSGSEVGEWIGFRMPSGCGSPSCWPREHRSGGCTRKSTGLGMPSGGRSSRCTARRSGNRGGRR
jgi:hypothetical protein